MSAAKKTSAKKAATKAVAKKAPVKKAATKRAPAKKASPKPAKPTMPTKGGSSKADAAALAKISELCLALPDTKLTMTWGSPHFRVAEKIFCGFGAADGKQVMSVKLYPSHSQAVVKEARFWPSPYAGKHGRVCMDVTARKSWDEVAELIRESYELVAPKASLAKLR